MKLRKARGLVLQALFQHDQGKIPLERLILWDWDRPNLPEAIKVGAEKQLRAVLSHLDIIDPQIVELSKDFNLYYLAAADRAILRMGLYYLIYPEESDIDPKLAINECLVLARNFSDENSYRLINRLLDKWAEDHALTHTHEEQG